MDNPLGMSPRQSICDLQSTIERLIDWEGPSIQALRQGDTRNEFHHDEIDAIHGVNVMNGDDIGMVQSRRRSGFLNESALEGLAGNQFGRNDLQSNVAIQAIVV